MKAVYLCILLAGCDEDVHRPQVTDAVEASGAHTVFLAFDGVAITKGPVDDATTSSAKLVAADGMVSPLFRNNPVRGTRIRAIVDDLTTALAPYDIKLVTTRPDAGPYDMIVFGGTAQEVGFAQNIVLFSLAGADCGNSVPSNVGFVFEMPDPISDTHYAHSGSAMALLALSHGIPVARQATDCLCYDVDFTLPCDREQACTFGGAGTTAYDACDSAPTFDPHQAMLAAFGAHP